MKKSRYFFCIFPLLAIILLCSCHAQYILTVTVNTADMSDKLVDMLIPMDKDDPCYDRIVYSSRYFPDKDTEGIRQTEIAQYSKDGYRSMLVHYGLSYYEITQNANSSDVKFYLNGKREYRELCDKYKSFKIAVTDKEGRIICVSDEYKLSPKMRVYAEEINYDIDNNIVSAEYTYNRSVIMWATEEFSSLAMLPMAVFSPVFFFVFLFLRLIRRKDFPDPLHSIIFAMFTIPVILYLWTRLDYAFRTGAPLTEVWNDLCCEHNGNQFTAVLFLLPIVIFTAVLVWSLIHTFRSDGSRNSADQQK